MSNGVHEGLCTLVGARADFGSEKKARYNIRDK